MHTAARRHGPVMAALLAVFALLFSMLLVSPAQAADNRMENKERPWLSGPVCLEIDQARGESGADAAVEWCSYNGLQMQWAATYVHSYGGASYYQLKPRHTSDRCLGVQYAAHTNGAQIEQKFCSAGDYSQLWKFVYKSSANGKTYYEVVSRHSGDCLDKSGWNVVLWDCHGGDWQQWSRPF